MTNPGAMMQKSQSDGEIWFPDHYKLEASRNQVKNTAISRNIRQKSAIFDPLIAGISAVRKDKQ